MQVPPKALCAGSHGFSGQGELLPPGAEGAANFLLAVRIGSGRVEKVDSSIQRFLEQAGCLILGNTLYGQCAKAIFVHGKAGAAQSNLFHKMFRLSSMLGIFYHK